MSFRFRIAAWVVASCAVMIAVMMATAHHQLEEELKEGLVDPNHPPREEWMLHNSFSEEEIQDILKELIEGWLWVSLPLVVLSLGGGLLLAKRSLRPVHDINRQVTAMRPDSLHGGIRIPEADPTFENLVNHLNTLLDKAGTAYQEMAEFSARVAHELRTPLMLLRLRLERAPAGVPADFQEELQDELTRLSRFVERSLIAARAEQGGLTPTPEFLELSDLVGEVVEDYQLLAGERGLRLDFEAPEPLMIEADPDLLRQMLHGLLENSTRYGHSTISVLCRDGRRGPILEIANDLVAESRPTSGLGLGLRLVRGICRASGFGLKVTATDDSFMVRIRFGEGGNAISNDE